MIDYEKLKNFVKEKHLNHPIAGFDHIERVHDLCLHLSEGLNIDKEHLRVAAYLHDIAVPPYGPLKHNEKAPEVIGTLLSDLGLSDAKQQTIFAVIKTHTRYCELPPESIEAQILRDADGIDYLGAVGILRSVLRGAKNGKYDGNVNSGGKRLVENLIQTVQGTFSTEKGIKIANERIAFLKQFIVRLDSELRI